MNSQEKIQRKMEIEALAKDPNLEILMDKDRFLLRVLKEKGKPVTIPNSFKCDINIVAKELFTILLNVIITQNRLAPGNVSCLDPVAKRLSDWWGYDEKRSERDLAEVFKNKKLPGSTFVQTLNEIRNWAALYRKEFALEDSVLRMKVVEFIEDSFVNVAASPFNAAYLNRASILKELIEFTPCALKSSIFYNITSPEKKRLTISEFSHESGRVVLEDGPGLGHLGDWKLEPGDPGGDRFKITAKVTELELTGNVSDKSAVLLLQKPKKAGIREWVVYKHRKMDKYAIINDSVDCLLGCRNDKDALSSRLDKKEDVWVWSVVPSVTK